MKNIEEPPVSRRDRVFARAVIRPLSAAPRPGPAAWGPLAARIAACALAVAARADDPRVHPSEAHGTGAEYLVIDVSEGPEAARYPHSFHRAEADIPGGPGADAYKTTRILLRRIPAPGSFRTGSPPDELGRDINETPRDVALTRDFFIGVYPVTQQQWAQVMGDWPSYFGRPAFRAGRPLEWRSWDEIRGGAWPGQPPGSGLPAGDSFFGRLRSRTGLSRLDLPTEAQWEVACRAGTSSALNNGKNLTDALECPNLSGAGRYWFNGGSRHARGGGPDTGTAIVGSYPPNAWGLFDMHGNVWEWCLDWYDEAPPGSSDPAGPASGSYRVLRGGAWGFVAGPCRSAARYMGIPWVRCSLAGFRIALAAP